MLLMVLLLANSSFAGSLNPSQYVIKGIPSPFSGYVVETERLQKCVQAVQELEYEKKYNDLQTAYYEEKLKNQQLTFDLQMKVEKGQNDAVTKELKSELSDKSVFYRQPWFTIPATVIIMLLVHVPAGL